MNRPKPVNRGPDKTIIDLLIFIEKGVETFTNSSPFKNQYHGNSDEDHLTEILVCHYQETNRHHSENYLIMNQPKQKNKRKVDIGFGLHSGARNYLFCIEAKILPTREYVTSNTGAIKRFKKCEHGLSSSNPNTRKPLSYSGIVAYVKSGTFDEHFLKINEKILENVRKFSQQPDEFDLTWHDSEQLNKVNFSPFAKLLSRHPRQEAPDIRLYHFWIYIN
jgi:hypothetical protein